MTEHYDYGRISPTAKLVAYARRYSDIPYAAAVAEAARVDEAVAQMFRDHSAAAESLPFMAPMAEIRYKSMVTAIRREAVDQVIEFASGLSLRGLALTKDDRMVYVETDLSGMSAEKQRIIRDLRERCVVGNRPTLHFHDVNALEWSSIEPALAHFQPDRPVAVVHEGLFQYLDFAEKEQAAQNIARILQRHGGVWLTPDLETKGMTQHWQRLGGERGQATMKALVDAVTAATSRDFEANAFDNDQHVHDFFGRLGFTVEARPQWDDSFEVSSVRSLKLPAEVLAGMQRFKLWTLRLR